MEEKLNKEEKDFSFLKRLYIYQKERFPVVTTLVATIVFTFSAISYSRLSRGLDGFVGWDTYAIGCFAGFTLFFLVRVFDEFKDKEDDAKYRKYLPVPRGLISLKELRLVGVTIVIAQLLVIALFQMEMLPLYLLVLGFLCLMGVEFFIPKFLKPRQILYITSHMLIFPLFDLYSSGLDWLMEGAEPHFGLIFFFVVSYFNGILVEFGRKMKAPEDEEQNVVSYTGMWGVKGAVIVWCGTLIVTLVSAILAAGYAGYTLPGLIILGSLAIICMIPALIFLKKPSKKSAKNMELISGLWTIGMYLSLGGIPMLMNLLG
jgi:4-hydroxybenzoate polyprenyltransferase